MKKGKDFFTWIKITAVFLIAVCVFCSCSIFFVRKMFSHQYLTEKTAQEWLEKNMIQTLH